MLPRFRRDWPGSELRPLARPLSITGRAQARKPQGVTYNHPVCGPYST
jgi:hypothetical protein